MAKEHKTPSFLKGLKIEKNQIDKEENTVDKNLVLEHYNFFEFDEIDQETLDFLKNKTFELHQVTSKAYTKLGNIFLESQEKLAEHYEGTFEKWYTLLGYKKSNVYRLMSRSNLGRLFPEKIDVIEALPISLSYEIASKNCSEELKNAVLNGEIKTLKEFKEFKQLEYKEEPNMVRDITPIDYEKVKHKTKSIEKIMKKARMTLFDKELPEEKLEKFNKNLEKLEKDLDKLFKIFDE